MCGCKESICCHYKRNVLWKIFIEKSLYAIMKIGTITISNYYLMEKPIFKNLYIKL